MDLLVIADTQRFLCAIENKVGTGEHGDQLIRYEAVCKSEFRGYRHHLVYLSPAGDEPSQPSWTPMGYGDLRELVKSAVDSKQNSLGAEVKSFLRHYCDTLGRHIVGDSVEELCQSIWKKHKSALDLIFEYRPDQQLQIRDIIQRIVEEEATWEVTDPAKAYFHFAPRSWQLPGLLVANTKSRMIVDMMLQNRPTDLTLYVEIQPGDQTIRSRIFEAAKANQPFRPQRNLYPQYARIYRRDILRPRDYEELDFDGLEDKIRQELGQFKATDLPLIDSVIQAVAQAG